MSNRYRAIVLPGDGIGPEVMRESIRVLDWFAKHRGLDVDLRHEEFGAEAYHRTGSFLREEVLADMLDVDLVLFGAMGGSLEENPIPQEVRRRFGLLRVRREMNLFANLRPVRTFPALSAASPLKETVTEGVDFIVVRELIGGIYFGQPRGIETLPDGQRRAFNTQVYTTSEITRIGDIAFDAAKRRRRHVTSVDKANVMESGVLWREEMTLLQRSYPEVTLDHLYVDACAAEIVRHPRRFDVLVTDNLFGDVLSDCAAAITGSLGMLPSASLSEVQANGRRRAFYEPVHGSAPDIAGTGKANPCAAILSLGLALEASLGRSQDARLLDQAVDRALQGQRTADLAESGVPTVSTSDFGTAVLASLNILAGVA